MNKKITTGLLIMVASISLIGAGCGSHEALTEEEQAAERGMSIEEFREMKEAAARMNMDIDEHMNM